MVNNRTFPSKNNLDLIWEAISKAMIQTKIWKDSKQLKNNNKGLNSTLMSCGNFLQKTEELSALVGGTSRSMQKVKCCSLFILSNQFVVGIGAGRPGRTWINS